MHNKVKSFSQFFYGSHFFESIKVTIGVLTPAMILAQFQQLEMGIALSLGAVCANIVDSPGPMVHRRNAMLITSPLLFVFTFLSCIINVNPYLTGIYLALCSFVFSMLYVYNLRAAAVGISVLLMVVLSLDDHRSLYEITLYSGAILLGSLWYTALSYAFHKVRPYRFAQQSISEHLLHISDFIRIKADFYLVENDYFENYQKLISKQIIINDEQDAIREILFTTRNIVKDGTPEGRFLTQVFRDSVDLFEQLMSTQYDYQELRIKLTKTEVLYKFHVALNMLSNELDAMAYALNLGEIPRENKEFENYIQKLNAQIHALKEEQDEYGYSDEVLFGLQNIATNIQFIFQKINIIASYFSRKKDANWTKSLNQSPNLEAFITRNKKIDFSVFRENLSFKSKNFRFAIRFTIIMLVGFVISKLLNSSHSYWVLLSILVILKPGFSQTKQRNIHRTIGTFFGGLMGLSIIYFVHNTYALFFILLFCMLMAFSFMRKNYVIYVLFMTPYLFATYSFLGIGNSDLVKERITDTLIGAAIAFVGSYILLPTWEYSHAKNDIEKCLNAINMYFEKVCKLYVSDTFDTMKYKLARKEMYIQLSNMASMVNNMFEEPKSKQLYIREIQQINSLMHLFASYTASLFLYNKEHHVPKTAVQDLQSLILQIQNFIRTSAKNIASQPLQTPTITKITLEKYDQHDGGKAVRDMLLTIQNLSAEIYKLSNKLH